MSKLRRADWLAGAAGVFLLVTLFLPWYGVTVRPSGPGGGTIVEFVIGRLHATAWQAFGVIDILVALAALLAIAVPVVTATASGPAKPVAFTVLSSVGSSLAVLLILYRLLNQPGPNDLVTIRYGAWLGLLAVLLTFAACVNTMRDESTPGAAPPDIPRRPAP